MECNGSFQTTSARHAEPERKCLQIDELIEYALQHSDLFYPSRAERVVSFAETAQG
jgi:hypothetical protein